MAETSGILRQLAAHAREDARIYREKGSGPATRADAETVADAMDIAAGARERLADALDEITRLQAEIAEINECDLERRRYRQQAEQAEAEREALRAELSEWQQAAKAIQRDKDSEQDRRVAAQEAITLRWEPQVEALQATLAAVREKLRALIEKIESMEQPINACITMSAIHGAPYTGPNWSKELTRAKSALLDGTAPKEGK